MTTTHIRLKLQMLFLFAVISITSQAQVGFPTSNIGDPAPQLHIQDWIKGAPITSFEKGRTYIVEFWATWCAPCVATIPRLSSLAEEYKSKVTVLGVTISSLDNPSKVKAYVDSLGDRITYQIATVSAFDDLREWIDSSDNEGFFKSFVIDAEGKIAWIGHTYDLGRVLPDIVNNTWNIRDALNKRKEEKRLAELDDSLNYELMRFSGNPQKPGDLGKPDSALLLIAEAVEKEPNLKYAPFIAANTFSSLLKTNLPEAYKYGKAAIASTTAYYLPPVDFIIDLIRWYDDKLKLPPQIYHLGAEAYQAKIDQSPYKTLLNLPLLYRRMAAWYWQGEDKANAIIAQKKAIEILKVTTKPSINEIRIFEAQLKVYQGEAEGLYKKEQSYEITKISQIESYVRRMSN